MELKKVWAVYYSATGTTAKTVRAAAEALARRLALPMEEDSFTRPGERARIRSYTESDLVVVGSPTYAGRLPNKLLPDFRSNLRGNGALAVPVVMFGNRGYDNALAELCALLEAGGFHTVAAGAFVGRHAFTDALAFGRPGWSDLREAEAFAVQIADKVRGAAEIPAPVQAPGDPAAAYYVPRGVDGEPAKFLRARPRTELSRCSGCGACVRACPMGAIDPADPARVPGTCIKCQSCVRRCTRRAKYFDDPAFLSHVAMLENTCREPKSNETFLY